MTHVIRIKAPTGRWAIMARENKYSPWVQVESISGEDNANWFLEKLDNDDESRLSYIEDCADVEWGDDAPSKGDLTDGR
jgi:hypothetical protein